MCSTTIRKFRKRLFLVAETCRPLVPTVAHLSPSSEFLVKPGSRTSLEWDIRDVGGGWKLVFRGLKAHRNPLSACNACLTTFFPTRNQRTRFRARHPRIDADFDWDCRITPLDFDL